MQKTRAVAALIRGLLATEALLNIMVLTKENAQAFAEHLAEFKVQP